MTWFMVTGASAGGAKLASVREPFGDDAIVLCSELFAVELAEIDVAPGDPDARLPARFLVGVAW
jgi:hypothetical protein